MKESTEKYKGEVQTRHDYVPWASNHSLVSDTRHF